MYRKKGNGTHYQPNFYASLKCNVRPSMHETKKKARIAPLPLHKKVILCHKKWKMRPLSYKYRKRQNGARYQPEGDIAPPWNVNCAPLCMKWRKKPELRPSQYIKNVILCLKKVKNAPLIAFVQKKRQNGALYQPEGNITPPWCVNCLPLCLKWRKKAKTAPLSLHKKIILCPKELKNAPLITSTRRLCAPLMYKMRPCMLECRGKV